MWPTVPTSSGSSAAGVESAQAQTALQQYQLEATYLTLTSNVVAAAIQEASLRGQIEATRKIIKIENDLLGLLKRQLALGQVAVADVLVQEAALAAVELLLPPLEKQLALQRDLLTALAGRYPSNEIEEKFTLASLKLPSELAGQPSIVLGRASPGREGRRSQSALSQRRHWRCHREPVAAGQFDRDCRDPSEQLGAALHRADLCLSAHGSRDATALRRFFLVP